MFTWQDLARPKPCPHGSPMYRRIAGNTQWIAQEKVNGWRVLLEVSRGGGIAITTRTGERLAMPRTDSLQVASVVPALSQLDCELIRPWRALIVFDVLRLADRDMARTALSERLMRLGALSLDGSKLGSVRTVRCGNVDEVDEFYNGVLAGGGEGIVLKRLEDPYPAKGVVWLKTKPGL